MAKTTTPVKPTDVGRQVKHYPTCKPNEPLKARVAAGDYGPAKQGGMSEGGRGRR